MNCMRVPALQTLLLYSRSLDTNINCTRILCDNWLELAFLDSDQAQDLLFKVIRLRGSIENLFKTKLESKHDWDDSDKDEDDCQAKKCNRHGDVSNENRLENLTKMLKNKLTEFLDCDILYSLRRVLPAELKTIFIKNYSNQTHNTNEVDSKVLDKFSNVKENMVKGGFKATEYLTFNRYFTKYFHRYHNCI
jgi:hypothetical protein